MSESDLKSRIKSMMIENLMLKMAPEDIGDDTPLFSPEGLALDSIDALELAVGIEKNFGVATPNAEVAREAFVSVNTIAAYITAKKKLDSIEKADSPPASASFPCKSLQNLSSPFLARLLLCLLALSSEPIHTKRHQT